MLEAIEFGAEDFSAEEDVYEVTTSPDEFSQVREALEGKGYNFIEADVEMVPQTITKLEDPKQIELMDKLVEHLEDLDDVQNVYHNWEEE
jgi:transcriptional/translational regulatory protein YebC/TACO1